MNKHLDSGSLAIAFITLGLFIAALFAKGISHDLFLESGVFLVSVKIIVMSYKNSVAVEQMSEKLDAILAKLEEAEKSDDSAAHISQDRSNPRDSTGPLN